MKTKYVCRGLISLYVNFHNNRTMRTECLLVKFCRWWGGGGGGGGWGGGGGNRARLSKLCSVQISNKEKPPFYNPLSFVLTRS